jgi:4-amino-4-deoxy-L-arabinose transferase-like glycosyltransferase
MAVLFSSALLLSLEAEPRLTVVAALLGLATLAKSLLPLVLFLPVIAVDYRNLREWLRPGPILAFLAVSLPWHILCFAANGIEFPRVLFVEHQFGRMTSGALQHTRPVWYYIPAMMLLLYPWFPLLALVPRDKKDLDDQRVRTLYGIVLFGLLFLSLSVNKLVSYVLPLLPCLCILIGIGVSRLARSGWLIALPVALLGVLVPAARILPQALAGGLGRAPVPWSLIPLWAGVGLLTGFVLLRLARQYSVFAVAGLAAVCLIGFQTAVFPEIDRLDSARPLWTATHPVCVPALPRRLLYGLFYYAEKELPPCTVP